MTSTLKTYASTESRFNPILPTQKQVAILLSFSHPVTLSFTDLQKRVIQLWKYKTSIFASVEDTTGRFHLIPGSRIHNALQPKESSPLFLDRLEQSPIKRWQFSYIQEKGSIQVWPWMLAAGVTPEQETARIDRFERNKEEVDKDYKEYGRTRLEVAKRELYGDVFSINRKDGKPHEHFIPIANARRGIKEFETFCRERIAHYTNEGNLTKKSDWEAHLKDAHNYIKKCNEYVIDIFDPPPVIPVEGEKHDINKPLRATAQISRIARRIFNEMVQQNHLEDSYNSGNPTSSIPPRGSSGGSIGGVGNEVGIIEGLFSTCDALEETEHYFHIPAPDGEKPFSDRELSQILQELACGIFVHDSVPFFSLHFNAHHDMYPVIHPAYQNTLVGKVVSMLDYYMKGFLNGAFFPEEFVWGWQESKSQSLEELKKHYIDLHAYCQKHLDSDSQYFSVMEFVDLFSKKQNSVFKDEKATKEEALLSDYSAFRSSFRIIAKQNSFKKGDGLFMLDGDFDVLYTIEPDPVYARELNRYRSYHGKDPKGYHNLVQAYEAMSRQIKTLMPKLPMFKKLFAQLNVINFFSYYFKTLKQAQKVPLLKDVQKDFVSCQEVGCPPLFPLLPIRKTQRFEVVVNFNEVFDKLEKEDREYLKDYLAKTPAGQKPPAKIVDLLLPVLRNYIQALVPLKLPEDRSSIETDRRFIEKIFEGFVPSSPEVMQKLKSSLNALQLQIVNMKKSLDKILDSYQSLLTAQRRLQDRVDQHQLYQNQIETPFISPFRSILAFQPLNAVLDARENLRIGYNKLSGHIMQKIDGSSTMIVEQNMLAQIQKEIDRRAELEKSLEEKIEKQKELEELIRRYESGSISQKEILDQLPALSVSQPVAVTEFYFEQPEKERNQTRRVVGGCGINLQNQPVVVDPIVTSLFSQALPTFLSMDSEQLKAINSIEGVEGYVFKLPIADFRVVEDQEYAWMSHAESSEEDSQALAVLQISDKTAFFKATSKIKRPSLALIHSAALADSPFYLRILSNGHYLTRNDVHGYTVLHHAAQAGRLENVQFLLTIYPQLLNQEALNGATPLYLAAQQGALDVVRFLMREKANPNLTTNHGMSPLYCAIHHGHTEIALELLKFEAVNVNLGLEDGTTPLHAAVEFDLVTVVRRLLERGALVNAPRKDSYTPLHIAAQQGSINVCHALVAHKDINVNARLKSQRVPLHLAIEENDIEIVGLLLLFGADPIWCGWDRETCLMTAIRCGNVDAALLIIDCWMESPKKFPLLEYSDIKGNTPLSTALALKQHLVVEKLLSCGVILSNPGSFVPQHVFFLYELCQSKYNAVYIDQWIKQHSFTQEQLQKACGIAAKYGHNEMVSLFQLDYGIEDVVDQNGWGLVHFAAQYDNINVIRRFLKKKPSDLLQVTKDGFTIVTIAARCGSLRVLKLMLEALFNQGIILDKSYPGKHPLLTAIETRELGAIDLILQTIPDPNLALDKDGLTAGHYAVAIGNVAMVDLLLKRGVDFNRTDNSGRTVFQYGFEYKWQTIIDYFLDPIHDFKLPQDFIYRIAHLLYAKYIPQLVNKGCLINNVGATHTKETPLFRAIREDNYDFFVTLCAHGAQLEARSSSSRTPFLLAAELGKTAFVAYLLPRVSKKQTTSEGKNALDLAVARGHEETVQYLIDQGFDPSGINRTHLPHHIAMILQGKGQELKKCKKDMIKALKNDDTTTFLQLANPFAFQTPMTFEVDGKSRTTFLLHLVYELVDTEKKRKSILDKIKIDPLLKDPEGRTIRFIQAQKEEELDFDVIDPLEKDKDGTTILHLCACHKSKKNLEKALKKCPSVDVRDNQGFMPLHYAAEYNLLDNVDLLLQKDANPNHMSQSKISPVLHAVLNNSRSSVQSLLNYGAMIDLVCLEEQATYLLIALEKDLFDMARFLINQGAKIDKADREGRQPIHIAAKKGHIGLVRHLVSKGASLRAKDNQGKTVAHYAAESDEPRLLDYLNDSLLREGAQEVIPSVHKSHPITGWTPMHFAAKKGNVPMLQKLKSKGVKYSSEKKEDESIFALAISSGNREATRFFEREPELTNKDGYTIALITAIAHENIEELKSLLPATHNSNGIYGQTPPLQYTAINQSLRSAHYLMKYGADPQKLPVYDSSSHKKTTPLERAIKGGHLALVRQMIQESATFDIFQRTSSEKTYLHHACEAGEIEIGAHLIELGALLDEKDAFQMTPLRIALKQENYQLSHLLLAVGAHIPENIVLPLNSSIKNLVDTYKAAFALAKKKEETSLHTAVRLNDQKYLRLLLSLNDIGSKDKKGRTALQLAASHNNLAFIQAFIRWAKIDSLRNQLQSLIEIASKHKALDVLQFLKGLHDSSSSS